MLKPGDLGKLRIRAKTNVRICGLQGGRREGELLWTFLVTNMSPGLAVHPGNLNGQKAMCVFYDKLTVTFFLITSFF